MLRWIVLELIIRCLLGTTRAVDFILLPPEITGAYSTGSDPLPVFPEERNRYIYVKSPGPRCCKNSIRSTPYQLTPVGEKSVHVTSVPCAGTEQ